MTTQDEKEKKIDRYLAERENLIEGMDRIGVNERLQDLFEKIGSFKRLR